MRFVVLFVLAAVGMQAHAAQRFIDQTGAQVGIYSEEVCGVNQYCYDSAGKLAKSPHYKANISTSTVLTQALCGQTFYVTADSKLTLPEASSVPGCRYEIINGMSTWSAGTLKNVRIQPAASPDHIRVLAANAGSSLKNSTFGSSVILESVADDFWVPVGKEQGTWTDLGTGN